MNWTRFQNQKLGREERAAESRFSLEMVC